MSVQPWEYAALPVGVSHAAFDFGSNLFGGGGNSGPNIDINAELGRINDLYAQARTQGEASLTQDYQAQRGELAQSQAARGILRSGVSQLGLARLGAGRQQALAQFNSQLSASQAGQQSSLLNALLGRKTALDTAAADRQRAGQMQLLGIGGGLLGSYLAGPLGGAVGTKVASQGANFFGGNYVNPQPTGQSFYQGEFGGYPSAPSMSAPSYGNALLGVKQPAFGF